MKIIIVIICIILILIAADLIRCKIGDHNAEIMMQNFRRKNAENMMQEDSYYNKYAHEINSNI